jgi:hypothetical protein
MENGISGHEGRNTPSRIIDADIFFHGYGLISVYIYLASGEVHKRVIQEKPDFIHLT